MFDRQQTDNGAWMAISADYVAPLDALPGVTLAFHQLLYDVALVAQREDEATALNAAPLRR